MKSVKSLSLLLLTSLVATACNAPMQTNSPVNSDKSGSIGNSVVSEPINNATPGTTINEGTASINSVLSPSDKDFYQKLLKSSDIYDQQMARRIEANAKALIPSSVTPYRHLDLTTSGSKFAKPQFTTKGTVAANRSAVIAKIGSTEYVLSREFMAKIRDVTRLHTPLAQDTGNNNVKSILNTVGLNQIKGKATIAVAGNNSSLVATTYTPTYTNSTSETAFITAVGTFSSVSFPNYLYVDDDADTNIEPTDDSALTDLTFNPAILPDLSVAGATDFNVIINTTGVRNGYYQDVYNLQETTGAGVITKAEIDSLQGVSGAAALPSALTPSAAEKAYFAKLLALNPYAPSTVLLDGTLVPTASNLSFYYMDSGTPGATPAAIAMNTTMISRVKDTFPQTDGDGPAVDGNTDANFTNDAITNLVPASTVNLSGATAAIMAKILTEATEATAMGAINALTADDIHTAFPATYAAMTYSDFHRSARELTMQAGANVAPTTVAPTVVKFGTLVAPTPVAVPVNTDVAVAALPAAEFGNMGLALEDLGFTSATRIVKSTATTLKSKLGIETFFGNTPGPVLNKALIVPGSRSATGVITFSATGTHHVVITATVTALGDYIYAIYDPGYNNGQGTSYYTMGISNPSSTMVTALYNYAGTAVGVTE